MRDTRHTCLTRDSNRRLDKGARATSVVTGMTCQTRRPRVACGSAARRSGSRIHASRAGETTSPVSEATRRAPEAMVARPRVP